MARVPTWAELRTDVTKLAILQKECYNCVHVMLEKAIPELDYKIATLTQRNKVVPQHYHEPPSMHEVGMQTSRIDQPPGELITHTDETEKAASEITQVDLIGNAERALSQAAAISFVIPTEERKALFPSARNENVKRPSSIRKKKATHLSHKKVSPKPKSYQRAPNDKDAHPEELDLNQLEHLKPLPLPLSEYLRRNRPNMVLRADRWVSYMRGKSLMRKQDASAKINNMFERIRLTNCQEHHNRRTLSRQRARDQHVPDYHVKYKMSEGEMRRLTAKIYERLPEVKDKRREEVTNVMRIRNYRKKCEYASKLLENRRKGIINYPLRSNTYESGSVESTDITSMNGCEGDSLETSILQDPYY